MADLVVVLVAALLAAAPAAAQQTAPDQVIGQGAKEAGEAEEDGADTPAEDPSRETDVSEDNYRRFMELEDRQLERPPFPVAAYVTRSGMSKVDGLPEASQKHLRNQLRGLIVMRGEWTPEERNRPYPFVPSETARQDAALLRQEAEAWTELVADYHDREEAILAGQLAAGQAGMQATQQGPADSAGPPGSMPSPGNRPSDNPAEALAGQAGAAPGPSQAQGQQPSEGQGQQQGQQGQGQQGQGQQGQASEQAMSGEDGDTTFQQTSYDPRRLPPPPPEARPSPQDTPGTPSNEGVEQSAADYLRDRGIASQTVSDAPPPITDPALEGPSRWGEQAQTLLPRPAEEEAAPPTEPAAPPAGRSVSDAARASVPGNETRGGNVLTLDELLQVRGVREGAAEEEDGDRDGGAAGGAGNASPGTSTGGSKGTGEEEETPGPPEDG